MPVERRAADLIIANGLITLDAGDSTFQAIAMKGETIVGLGSNDELRALADAQTRVIDAAGRLVMPAFIDGHVHFHSAALSMAYFIDYEALRPKNLSEALRPFATGPRRCRRAPGFGRTASWSTTWRSGATPCDRRSTRWRPTIRWSSAPSATTWWRQTRWPCSTPASAATRRSLRVARLSGTKTASRRGCSASGPSSA